MPESNQNSDYRNLIEFEITTDGNKEHSLAELQDLIL